MKKEANRLDLSLETQDLVIDQINLFIHNKKLKQNQIALALDISNSTLSGYLTKRHPVSLEFLVRFCRHFNISLDYLVGLSAAPENLKDIVDKYTDTNQVEDFELSQAFAFLAYLVEQGILTINQSNPVVNQAFSHNNVC